MQQKKKLGRMSLLIVLLVLLACVSVSAQTTSEPTANESNKNHAAQDSETLRALEVANIRLAAANETIKLLNDRLAAKDAVIEAREAKVELRDEQLALAKSASQDRVTVNTGDAVMLRACELQLTRADLEISKLRNPPFFKKLFSTESLMGFGIGYGTASMKK